MESGVRGKERKEKYGQLLSSLFTPYNLLFLPSYSSYCDISGI
jgi:hypothetical protein